MMIETPSTKAASLRAARTDTLSRDRRRTETRRHICNTANGLFVTVGFVSSTMEEIARSAGIQRSTLYTYFADKEQILTAIGEAYVEGVCETIRLLPGPVPSAGEIDEWIALFADFVLAQPGPAELVMAVGRQIEVPQAGKDFGIAMMRAFAERIEAFAKALRPGEDFRLAWAHATLSELGSALTHHARHKAAPDAQARLNVAAMLLRRFVREEC